jgi:integrase
MEEIKQRGPYHRNDGLRKLCGCKRRQWAKCPHGWHFSFKWGETHHRFSLDKHLGKHIDNKTDADDEAEKIRIAIRAGRFGAPTPRDEMTLRQLADTYLDRYVKVERADTADDFRSGLRVICETELQHPTGDYLTPFGDWRLTDIVTDTVERYREARHARGAGVGGTNRSLSRLRALLNWGIRVGYLDHSPFKRHTETVVRLSRETPRGRRLQEGEETSLLAACAPHLRAVVECALETGMRRGEILSLQWMQVEGLKVDGTTAEGTKVEWAPRAELVLPAPKTKTRRDRRIPISKRLRAILEMRRFDPAGQPIAAEGYVFGNELGQRVDSTKRAWLTAVLKSHGYPLKLTKTCNLTAECRAALDAIDLHFHDLRREAGSRWLEGAVPLHTIRDWLGHTSIAQTSTYLAGTVKSQHDAMRQFEERRAALQKLATDSKTGGRKSPRTAGRGERKPNKTAVGREQGIM